MSIADRLYHAWSAFRYGDAYRYTKIDYGESSGWRPDITRFNLSNEQSFIASVYNRFAVDVAALNFRHVRVDENDRYLETIKSSLNDCLSTSANIDQTGRQFIQDLVISMFDEGNVGIMPTTGELNKNGLYIVDIGALRVCEIIQWYPEHVRVRAYNEKKGVKEETILPKSMVAIIENPFYAVVNEPNAMLKRLIRKLNYMDDFDAKVSAGKLDLIIQVPYVVKTDARKKMAEKRLQDIRGQLEGSNLGIAYADGTEKIIQLNRPIENALLPQVEYLTKLVYSQLGVDEEILNGTAGEEKMNNYMSRTIEPIATAIAEAVKRTFLTKTARTQGQSIMYFRDPFKLATLNQIADAADTFIRDQVLSANDIRACLGFKPDPNPQSDQLINPNMPQDDSGLMEVGGDEMTEEDYQQAFADLDDIDAQLDELEGLVDGKLAHYASPYYDPKKAHEYYMRTRELKGRKSTATLNDQGKAAAKYVKEQLTTERKEKQQDSRDETNADISSVKSRAQQNIESARDRKLQQIENHKQLMNAKIETLRASLEGLSGAEKKAKSAEVKADISSLREQNKAQRDELNAEYKEYTARIRSQRSEDISDLRTEGAADRKRIKSEYDEKYIDELDRIKADPTMIKQKKSSSKSTRKSVLKQK